MSNHTPGPWVAEPVQGGISITGHMGAHVARIGYRDNAAHADARLIAAAPDMLESLRKIGFECASYADCWEVAQAAYYAATGKETGGRDVF